MFRTQNVRRTAILAICGLTVSAMIFGSSVFADNQERPRTTQAPSPTPTPATPAPSAGRNLNSNSTTNAPAGYRSYCANTRRAATAAKAQTNSDSDSTGRD